MSIDDSGTTPCVEGMDANASVPTACPDADASVLTACPDADPLSKGKICLIAPKSFKQGPSITPTAVKSALVTIGRVSASRPFSKKKKLHKNVNY